MAIPRGDAADPRDGSADAQSDEDASETPEPSRFVTTALVSSSVVTHAVRGRFRAPGELAVVLTWTEGTSIKGNTVQMQNMDLHVQF